MARMNHTNTQENCKQIERIGFLPTMWSSKHEPVCVLRIKVSVWSLRKYYMKKNAEDVSQQIA